MKMTIAGAAAMASPAHRRAARSTVAWSNGRPTICIDSGRPLLLKPMHCVKAGPPVILNGVVSDGRC